MTQMVMAVEDVERAAASARCRFLRASLREVAGIFGVVLVLVVLATVASILATAGLGLIAFVPLVGLAVLPLQIAAWLVRGIRLPVPGADRARRLPDAVSPLPRRAHARRRAGQASGMIQTTSRMINYDAFLSRAPPDR